MAIKDRLSEEERMSLPFIARDWHGGQWSGLYALNCGDLSDSTLERARWELHHAIHVLDSAPLSDELSGDDSFQEALDALESLERACSSDD
jgi:hypothetical protein